MRGILLLMALVGIYTCAHGALTVVINDAEGVNQAGKTVDLVDKKGTDVVFTCSAVGATIWEWTKVGSTTKLTTDDLYTVKDGALTIKKVSAKNAGTYTCTAKDDAMGTNTGTSTVTLTYACGKDDDCTGDYKKCMGVTCKCPTSQYKEDGDNCYYECTGVTDCPNHVMNEHIACTDGRCGCDNGYEGLFTACKDIDECTDNATLCQNGGTCLNQEKTAIKPGYTCTCVKGWIGTNCEINEDDCAKTSPADPCFNGGTCEDQIDGYTCTCPSGYTGKVCDTKTGSGVAALSTSVVVVVACAVAVALFL